MCRWVLSCVLTVPAKHSWHQILRQSASSHILGVGKNIPGIYVLSRELLTLRLWYHIPRCIASGLKRKFFTMYFKVIDTCYSGGYITKRQYTNFLSSLAQKTKDSNYFCNPRSLDKFLMVQLCWTSFTTLRTICEFVHVNLDTAEILLSFYFVFRF